MKLKLSAGEDPPDRRALTTKKTAYKKISAAEHLPTLRKVEKMIVLVMSVCLLAEANTCKNVHLAYSSQSVTPMQCLMGGQAQIAQWSNGHPKWRVKRWKCAPAAQIAQDI